MGFIVHAGEHDRDYCPVAHQLPQQVQANEQLVGLLAADSKRRIPCQLDPEGRLHWVVKELPAGQSRRYVLEPHNLHDEPRVRVHPARGHEDRLEVYVHGDLLTAYCCGRSDPKPYLFPLIGPDGLAVTRNFPMRKDVPGETTDHPHHRSCWVAWGDVNGVDNWTEEPGCGVIRQNTLHVAAGGAVCGLIEAEIEWRTGDGRRQLTELRTYRFYACPPDYRLIDQRCSFQATDGDVRFGDTKEGGICSIRVATTMQGDRGGLIRLSTGSQDEPNCWGRPATWCDYVGNVQRRSVGIAIFDHPDNANHPTRWHVRAYGLMTANPFGLSIFDPDARRDGSLTVPAGGELAFRHRILLHRGGMPPTKIEAHYQDFADPPTIEVLDD